MHVIWGGRFVLKGQSNSFAQSKVESFASVVCPMNEIDVQCACEQHSARIMLLIQHTHTLRRSSPFPFLFITIIVVFPFHLTSVMVHLRCWQFVGASAQDIWRAIFIFCLARAKTLTTHTTRELKWESFRWWRERLIERLLPAAAMPCTQWPTSHVRISSSYPIL